MTMKDKPVILVVDDQPKNIELLEAYLVPEGYEIVPAESGEEALDKLSVNQIDLILLDVMMPGMDGFKVTRMVRQDNIHRLLPIILVTALRETEDRVKGIEAGCDDFISKPVDKIELLARVRSLLKVKTYNDLMSNYQQELESEVARQTEELKHSLENLQKEITERKLAEEKLLESKTLFEAVVENIPFMIFLKEATDLRFVIFNRAGEELLGHDRKDLLGKNNLDLFPPEQAAHFMAKDREVLDGKTGVIDIPEELIQTAKKGQRLLHTKKVCIMSADGAMKYLLGISEDITDRKEAEEKLHESTRRLTLAMASAKAGVWDWNIHTNEMIWDDRMLEFYGLTHKNFPGGIEAWEQGLHPDDSSRAMEECQAALRGERDFNTEFRVRHPDGKVVHLRANGLVLRDEEGKPLRMIGLNTDITERKRAEEKLQQTLESLRKSFGATVQVIASAVEARDPYTSGHQIRSANLACAIATELGFPPEKIECIRMVSSIHDVGKLSIPAELLSKPTKLSELEFSMIKEHAQRGYEMLKDVESPWPLAEIVHQHHERMDGSGYPRNLKGEEILMEARILSVADVVEAMASHRPYRAGLGIDSALNEIEKNSGIFYDKTIADACLRLFREKGFKLEEA